MRKIQLFLTLCLHAIPNNTVAFAPLGASMTANVPHARCPLLQQLSSLKDCNKHRCRNQKLRVRDGQKAMLFASEKNSETLTKQLEEEEEEVRSMMAGTDVIRKEDKVRVFGANLDSKIASRGEGLQNYGAYIRTHSLLCPVFPTKHSTVCMYAHVLCMNAIHVHMCVACMYAFTNE